MIALLMALVATLRLGEGKGHKHCRQMELHDLCETPQGRECIQYTPDMQPVCNQYRMNKATKTTTILSSETVPYWDAAPPVILLITGNQTVAPGEPFEIRCMAEGAPAPFIEIVYKEDADLSPVPGSVSNSVDIEKRAVQTMMAQTYAIEQDEGWYRCVAKNGEGVIYEDTYLTIGDLCDTVVCDAPQVCKADYDLGIAECSCPFCTWENYETDPNLYCGTDCGVYYSRCSIEEEKCKGVDLDIFHDGVCSSFSLPEYSYEELQETEVYYGDEVELACRGIPAGDTPGPEPRIMWYQDWGADMGGRELIGEAVPQEPTTPPTPSPTPTPRIITPEPLSSTESRLYESTSPYLIPTTPLPPTLRADGGSVCQIMGDPMVSTFDNRWYKQDGVCTYVLAMDCRFAQWFVYGRFMQYGETSALESITIYSG
ncbi:uncharacterized protein LOC134812334 [Bolinopsis microptera]|uniref:uncharacterized protein LOC134812334 n=1 Tax=Bolinopsis microptera TaxID=2820187 RepID=UPI003078A722